MSSLDMSLDDLAKSNKPQRGGRGGGRGGRGGNQGGDRQSNGPIRNKNRHTGNQQKTPYQRAPQQQYIAAPIQYAAPLNFPAYAPQAAAPAPQPQPVKKIQGDTIHVANLAPDVTDDDVREIFDRIGPVKSANVNYNSSGKSTGTATVVFARKNDAEKAVQDYDEAEVDGRIMKLRLIGTVVTAPVVVKKSKPQVVAAPQPQLYIPQAAFGAQLQFQQSYQQRPQKQVANNNNRNDRNDRNGNNKPARGGRGGASSGPARGGRGGARGGRPARPAGPKSQEDLDSEMDNYHSAAEKKTVDPAAAGQPTSA